MIPPRVVLLSLITLAPTMTFAQEPIVVKHDGWVAAVAFAPDGKTLATAGADNVVRLWEVGTWKPKGVLKGHMDCVCAVAFDEQSTAIATGSYDHSAKLWNRPSAVYRDPAHHAHLWLWRRDSGYPAAKCSCQARWWFQRTRWPRLTRSND